MADYFIYANAETGYFARISDRALDDPNLVQVLSLPPDANHKWNGQAWIVLTPDEIEEIIEEAEEEEEEKEIEAADVETSTTTIPNSLVLWGNTTGDRLISSDILLEDDTLSVPYNLTIKGNLSYPGNGGTRLLDRQKRIEISEERHSQTYWQLIPGMQLTSANTETSFYTIEIELLLKTSRNNRDFEVALFINKQQQIEDSLNIDFNRGNDDRTINWSNDYQLSPFSLVEVYWRRRGSNVTCYVGRRKLAIVEI